MIKPLSKWILIRPFVLALVVWFLLAAINTSGGDNISGVIKSEKALGLSEGRASCEGCAILPNNSAHLTFSYGNRRGFRNAASKRTALVSQHAVYTIVGELKERIAFPFDIQVVFEECGGPDSYYDENTHEIVICYELIDAYHDLFSPALKSRTARDGAAKNTAVAMFLHEVAHALIDGWDLPITGREEDAADQFSTLLLINAMPDGDQIALDSAQAFKLLADLEKGQWQDFSDPHSLDEQRFFDTICLVYGHRPEHYEYLIRNGTLPVERAFNCEEDYARLNKSWQILLAPYLVAN
jgi:hypothetical protein